MPIPSSKCKAIYKTVVIQSEMTWTNAEISCTQNWTQLNCTKYLLVDILHEHANHMAYTYRYTHVCSTHVHERMYVDMCMYMNGNITRTIDNSLTMNILLEQNILRLDLNDEQWWASSCNIHVFNNLIQEATNRKKGIFYTFMHQSCGCWHDHV